MRKINLLKSIPYLLQVPSNQMWMTYDEDADVLYISFRKPQKANDSIYEDNIVYHYADKTLVGVTALNASLFSANLN
ncbi:DUF2283 domain-containing protein [Cyanobacterium aponinum]|uniref:DUF2283 domain-containing protein n=1 Tax=Cyanobacterium aponinum TaxID=379064 RepID=UPI000C12A50B|nr:DUF2283 domain-containing protein [Cyanobacterium aponinum]PHV62805.1 hypothetical protein CSQ80_08805 [Cyanobacterium aponinum IPPAS B-1201]